MVATRRSGGATPVSRAASVRSNSLSRNSTKRAATESPSRIVKATKTPKVEKKTKEIDNAGAKPRSSRLKKNEEVAVETADEEPLSSMDTEDDAESLSDVNDSDEPPRIEDGYVMGKPLAAGNSFQNVKQTNEVGDAEGVRRKRRDSDDFGDLCEGNELLMEPSPLDVRLRDRRNFNVGDWSSEELKTLYDGITTYGTTDRAIEFISAKLMDNRSLIDVIEKVSELREINSEHRMDRMEQERENWINLGYRGVRPPENFVLHKLSPGMGGWMAALNRIDTRRTSHQASVVQTAIAAGFNELSAPPERSVVVSNSVAVRGGPGRECKLNWERINSFVAAVSQGRKPIPGLNAFEASIVLSILDDIENEATQISPEDRAVIVGWMSSVQMADFRDFEPDTPCNNFTTSQVYLDPLRSRMFDIPKGGCKLTEEKLAEYETAVQGDEPAVPVVTPDMESNPSSPTETVVVE